MPIKYFKRPYGLTPHLPRETRPIDVRHSWKVVHDTRILKCEYIVLKSFKNPSKISYNISLTTLQIRQT